MSHHCGCAGISQITTPGLSPVTSCSAICNGTADNRSRAEYEHNPGHSFGSRNHDVSLAFVELQSDTPVRGEFHLVVAAQKRGHG